MSKPLLKVSGLSKFFPVKASSFAGEAGGTLRAVHNVSFELERGKTLGLVGESGCGKSTTGRLILRLIEPSSGTIELDGEDITQVGGAKLRALRKRMQIVFQDPLGSLHPRMTVGKIIAEPLAVHRLDKGSRSAKVDELLRLVELPLDVAGRYPHEFSGGQRQRISIARALALSPELIIADEPVSALDASIQSQILTLLKRLQDEQGMAFLFISHDLSVVRFLCHDVAVMYLGEIVEHGPVGEVYDNPQHPYTKALLAAIPRPEPNPQKVMPLEGQLPSAIDPPVGCAFASRCPCVMERCHTESPGETFTEEKHMVRCWLNKNTVKASG